MQRILPRPDRDLDRDCFTDTDFHTSAPDRDGHRYPDPDDHPNVYCFPCPNTDVDRSGTRPCHHPDPAVSSRPIHKVLQSLSRPA